MTEEEERRAKLERARAVTTPEPTVRGGKDARVYGAYGIRHDMDCPGCQDTPYLSSPRSETYWAS